MLSFVMFAALMLALALAFVLRPLLTRHAPDDPAALARRRMQALLEAHAAGVLSDTEFAAKRTELGDQLLTAIDTGPPRSRAPFVAATAVALLLPALSIVLYRAVGSPAALDPAALVAAPATAPGEHGQDMEQAIDKLAAKLKQNPGDAEGWALLGRAYLETQRFAEARDALKHAHDLVADDPDVGVAYAEALTLASESHQFDAQARALIETALKADPKNQRGIWLLGIADYQAGKFDAAIADWNLLLAQLPKDSTIAQSVRSQIARAEAARDGKPLPAETAAAEIPAAGEIAQAEAPQAATATTAAATAADGAHLTVKVTLDPNLTAQVSPADTVFVYAKAASGPPMPLAIQRLRADQLPATVVLTDSMGMLPSMKLSQFPQIIIGARISKSGNAIAQAGDLQTVSKPLDVRTTAPIALTIDQTVP
ncbi:MAG TPA: c-type cytochrome biogenesis protein CcmI, partial [Rudaea sp.]|nr:c-type cytochrome biogenesis protein CcmI [Rudaea sp.]